MDVSSDGGPAPSRGEEGGGSGGDKDSLRDVIDKIHSVTSRMAESSQAAKVRIAHADSNKQGCATLAGRLSGVLKTLTDVDSMLSDELAQIPSVDHNTTRKGGDRKTFRWLYNVSDSRTAGVSESSDETDRAAQHSKAVSVGDGKRSRVGTSSPAAAGAAAASSDGGCSIGASDATAAAAARLRGAQSRQLTQDYGRPCLPGLPEGVMGHMGSFMTTRTATARLTRVNKETRQKATDDTFGVFRHFSMTKDEEAKYQAIRKLKDLKHLGKIRTAHVEASGVVPCVVELLERSSATLKELYVSPDDKVHNGDTYVDKDGTPIPPARPAGVATPFPSLTHMNIQSNVWLDHISVRRWALPALTSLRVSNPAQWDGSAPEWNGSLASLMHLVETAPAIERLEAERIWCDDSKWGEFTAALGRCPQIKTIAGLDVGFGRLNALKQALDRHWAKPEKKAVRKKLGLVVSSTIIGADCREEAADLGVTSKWAAEVNCELEWRPAGELVIDCSEEASAASSAPHGVFGEVVGQLVAKATSVTLRLGGSPLHPSWRDKLIFPNAKSLSLQPVYGASTSAVVASIPEWLTERDGAGQIAASRCFPAVEQLDMYFQFLSFSDLPSAPSKLSRLVGGLRALKRVAFRCLSSLAVGCELLSYVSVGQLDEVEIAEPLSREWPASVPAEWNFRSPPIERLVPPHPDGVLVDEWPSKAGVQSFLQLVSTLRPASVDLTATLRDHELEGEDGASRLQAAHSFAWECYDRTKALYTMTGGSCEQVSQERHRLTMQLAAK
ncbi:unnamed protein product [Vitrella brassicaformis CCMP3155]|uniref:Uncharacterized protein n=2 Tax=Vitrella brassicaformis TaxID=1169539 RepID=A0A0G4FQC3_VITBC|nr:unnamed protein product [Vitrella brassicaformis CCMP3155]|eukprot:CEM16638.1 unnamed protein product [Vitrella brassicaformis CCMP3155]